VVLDQETVFVGRVFTNFDSAKRILIDCSGVKKNRHPCGVAALSVNSTEIAQNIWGAIKFFAEIDDQDKWLD